MNRKTVWAGLLCLGLALSACSGNAASSTAQTSSGVLNTNYDNALSVEMQLAFGTLKLEGSANEVSSETAAQLLPLWKAARSLSTSDGAAQEEIQAVYRQIEESMSAEQLQAIAGMQLTSTDMREISSQMGMNLGRAGGSSGTPDATQQANSQSSQAGGDMAPADFGGGMPAGGDPGGMPGGGDPGMMAGGGPSASSNSSSSTTNTTASNPLLDSVITYLEGKVG